MCLTSGTATTTNNDNNPSSLMLPSQDSSPILPNSNECEGKENEVGGVGGGDDDDDCSIGVNDLTDDKQGFSIVTGSQRTISPLSPRGENYQESSSMTLSMQAGSSLSKLDLLRARNLEVRRRSSLKIAELRQSLNASSGEVLSPITPQKKKKKVLVPSLTGNDDATAATVSSQTLTEPPPTPTSNKGILRLRPPLEVDMKDNESVRSIRTLESVNVNNFKERCKRLKQENELLRRQLTRMVEHHNAILCKERMNLRLELESRARASKNRLRMAVILLVIGWVGQLIMNYGLDYKPTIMSFFHGGRKEPIQVPFNDVVQEYSNDRMTIVSHADCYDAWVAEEIASSLLESRIEEDPPLGLIFDPTLLEDPGSNITDDTFHIDQEESILLGEEETILAKAKPATHRPGFLKRSLFNFHNNQMGIWLKHVKM